MLKLVLSLASTQNYADFKSSDIIDVNRHYDFRKMYLKYKDSAVDLLLQMTKAIHKDYLEETPFLIFLIDLDDNFLYTPFKEMRDILFELGVKHRFYGVCQICHN